MIIEKEHLIGIVLGMIPLFVIWFLFQNNDVLYTNYLKHYTSLANAVLASIGIIEFMERSKGGKNHVLIKS